MRTLSPIEWAVRPLKQYAVFSGRAPRAEYWWFYLATVVVGLGVDVIDRIAGVFGIIGGVYNLCLLVPSVAVTVRRLHDTDRSGRWLFAFVVPLTIAAISDLGA
jgi:uncharacterized membrane protein YhaH (DUF805 family)